MKVAWSRARLHFASRADRSRSTLPLLAVTDGADGEGEHIRLPSPWTVLRHACPVVLEAVVGPVVLFYLILMTVGFRGALIAALAWSYLALARRRRRGERVSTLLLLGTALLTARTVVAFITGNAFLYFVQPTASTVLVTVVLLGSAFLGRPITQRFAHDFCPLGPELLARPRVHRFFVRISVLWAIVLMINAGTVFWLLVTSSLGTFVLERTAATWALTALAIVLSITRFTAAMRRDGVIVHWGRYRLADVSPSPTL